MTAPTAGGNGLRRAAKLAVVLVIGLAGFLTLAGLSRGLSLLTTSEEAEEVFTEAAELPAELADAVVWRPDQVGLPRPIEPQTRADVTDAWLRAWAQLSVVAETGDQTGLEIYFSGSALSALRSSAADAAGLPVRQLGHELRVDFYSADGSIIGLEAIETELVRTVAVEGSNAEDPEAIGLAEYTTTESYEAVLVLEDGNWRIQHWIRTSVDGEWADEALQSS